MATLRSKGDTEIGLQKESNESNLSFLGSKVKQDLLRDKAMIPLCWAC